MRFRTLGFYSALSIMLAAFSMGCEPYHRHGVGIELDIHSKNYHKDKDNRNGDHHDNGRHEGDKHEDHHDND